MSRKPSGFFAALRFKDFGRAVVFVSFCRQMSLNKYCSWLKLVVTCELFSWHPSSDNNDDVDEVSSVMEQCLK